ncbi:gephyrin-like molybdotransferase Glp [Candidatus Cyanaurora vandensis]|uniref:molybdopterin molybdotransferase MoeA n=1 Tax=Candidatus Cyanaurora vandensis TaxID=2714958 RepID=UPI00257E3828|nr:gephyrin-like molybdotransferase Glp [Candidatus Cyanaurora vandensis]
MLTVEEVQRLVLAQVQVGSVESVAVELSLGRVLAQVVSTPQDIPAWANSAMDGYAVVCSDWTTDPEPVLVVVEEVPAGKVPRRVLTPGHCTRVLTGAMLPTGTEAVVMQERTEELADGRVKFRYPPQRGQFIRQQGEFRWAGAVLIAPGTPLTPAEIGILASLNYAQVQVQRPPLVAILSTGDELVPLGQTPALGQVLDSNQPMLTALVRAGGGTPWNLGIVPDDPVALAEVLTRAKTADFILSSGGVSVGTYDYVERVLDELGAQVLVRQMNLKPGKPLTFAHWEQACYWGLPGNPVSAFVGFWLTVYPALRKALGYSEQDWLLPEEQAVLMGPLKAGGDRRHYLRGRLHQGQFQPFGVDNSANFANLSGVNAFAILEQGQTLVQTGDSVRVVALP